MRTDETETHEEAGETAAEAKPLAMPTVHGFLAACEKDDCQEPSIPLSDVGLSPVHKGFCAEHGGVDLAKSHDPQCERCEKAAVQSDPPTTSTAPFRRGFCAGCAPKDDVAGGAKGGKKTAASSVKRPIEHWAKAKGMLPRILEQGKVEQTGRLVPARQNPKFADFHRARQGVPAGHELTEAEFDERVVAATQHAFR